MAPRTAQDTAPRPAARPAGAPAGRAGAIEAENLTKVYRGGARGIEDLSLRVEPGEVFGFLGPNGAGKSTTIRLMLDLIRPTSGRLQLLGRDARRDGVAIRARTGYLPGDLRLYPRVSGRELVDRVARMRGMDGSGDAPALARRLELDLDRPAGALSRGNRQKIGLVLAFMHRPELLLLDEPTSGLDPLMREVFAGLARESAERGAAVFLSSHVLSEVQRIAERVGVVREGRLVLVESVERLRARAARSLEVTFAAPPPPDLVARVPGARELGRRGATVRIGLSGPADPVIKRLAELEVLAIEGGEGELGDVFLDLYREDADAA